MVRSKIVIADYIVVLALASGGIMAAQTFSGCAANNEVVADQSAAVAEPAPEPANVETNAAKAVEIKF